MLCVETDILFVCLDQDQESEVGSARDDWPDTSSQLPWATELNQHQDKKMMRVRNHFLFHAKSVFLIVHHLMFYIHVGSEVV